MPSEKLPTSLGQMPRPLGERVLVRILEDQTGELHQAQNIGAFLIVPAGEKPKPARGVIEAVGPGALYLNNGEREYVPMDLNAGDEVLLYSQHGVPVVLGEGEEKVELMLVSEGAILVVLSSMRGEPAVNEGD